MGLSPGGLIKRPSTNVLTNIGIIKGRKSCQQLTENKNVIVNLMIVPSGDCCFNCATSACLWTLDYLTVSWQFDQ